MADGYKRKKGSKVHIALDTLGHLLASRVTAASEQDRAQVATLIEEVQAVAGGKVEVAFVDQGYTGAEPAAQAAAHGVRLVVVKLEEAKRGFVLLPRRWVLEGSFAWPAASADWPEMTSGSRPPSPASTGSLSSLSCSNLFSAKVQNTL